MAKVKVLKSDVRNSFPHLECSGINLDSSKVVLSDMDYVEEIKNKNNLLEK